MSVEADVASTEREPPWLRVYPERIDWHQAMPEDTLVELFEAAAAEVPNSRMLEFLGRSWTYGEIAAQVERAAAGFAAQGVGPGVKVGLLLPNCPYYVISFFAVLKAGGTVVNYNPLYAACELAQLIEDSRTEFMVTLDLALLLPKLQPLLATTCLRRIVVGRMADLLPFAKALLFPWVKRRDLARMPDDGAHLPFAALLAPAGSKAGDQAGRRAPLPDPDAVAVLQYTGGTTGLPKAAIHTHRSLRASAEQICLWDPQGPGSGQRILGVLPLFHVFAMTVVLLHGVRARAEIILLPRFELEQVLRTITRAKPTILPGVPTLFAALGQAPTLARYDLSSIRLCISGGAALPREVRENFERLSGCYLVEGYGLTEAPVTHCNPVGGDNRSGSVGVPMPATVVEIVSLEDRRTLLPQGERGEICIRGPQVMQGYWCPQGDHEGDHAGGHDADLAGVLVDGRLHTGDVGYLDADGYTYIVDRLKELIICSGYNVYPRQVEEAIYQHPAVAEAAVIGIADAYRGESVKAFVARRPGAALDAPELLAFLRERLSPIELPKQVEFRDALPKSAIGKILKKALRDEAGASAA